MSVNYELNATIRDDMGKGASRRLRRENKVPGVLYGAGKEAISIALDHDTVLHSLENEAFYSHILNISVNGTVEKAVLKDLQRHPHKPTLVHVDLQRVSETEKLRIHVPLHFIGEDKAPGVKLAGGVISHLMNDVEVSCFPQNLPEYLQIDVSSLELNEALHLSDIKTIEGVEIIELSHGADHDRPVVSIHMPRAAIEVEEEVVSEEAEAAEEEAAAPEETEKPGEEEKAS